MTTRIILAWLHLLALAVGLSGVWARARSLRWVERDPEDRGALSRVFTADMWWGIAALLWIGTGVWRLVGGTEKSTSYYMANHVFWLKAALFFTILALEIWPMGTLIRWRAGKSMPNARNAGRIEIISYVQCALVAAAMLAAVTMARAGGMSGAVSADTPVAAERADSLMLEAVTPSGLETVTPDDIALLTREIAMPLDGVVASTLHSSFDDRRGGGSRRHEALDIMSARRTPVHAATSGHVLKLFSSVAGGLMVYAADSSERFVLMYAHLDGYAPGLSDGATLARGQLVGYVGSTGNASANAPHLHFAIARSADVKRWSKGKPIDPLPVLQAATR